MGAHISVHYRVFRLISKVHTLDLVPLLLEPVHNPSPQPTFVDHHQRRFVLLDSVDHIPHHRHGVVPTVARYVNNIPALTHRNDRGVRAVARRVYPDDDGRGQVLVLLPPHRLVHDVRPNELVVPRAWEHPVDLDVRLARVRPVLLDNPLVDLLVRTLYRACVHHLSFPKRPLGVERFVEVPRVAARVGERQPEPVGRVLRKESTCHRPDRIGDTTGLVKHHQHAVVVMHTRVGVRILFRPQPPFDAPVPGALLQVPLDQFGQPLGGHQPGGRDFKPVAVNRHR